MKELNLSSGVDEDHFTLIILTITSQKNWFFYNCFCGFVHKGVFWTEPNISYTAFLPVNSFYDDVSSYILIGS